jgi:trigger factor
MQITEEKIDAQNALLKIKIQPEDYSSKFDQALRNYQKQVAMPGFRQGKVPMGMIKSRYGKSLLAEELNKMLNSSLQNYITEKDLQILGNPLPSDSHGENGDWDNPSEFEFAYELGLAPELNVQIDKKSTFDFYTIKIDDTLLDKQIKDIARRYGKLSEAEESSTSDMLVGDFVELDENDEVKPAGIMHQSTISVEYMGADVQKTFEGLKVGDSVVVDPHKVSRGHDDLAKLLNITHEEVHHIHTNFKFIVREIKRLQPADLNQEFYDKIFGENEVTDEATFRSKISEDMSRGFLRDSDQLFKRDITTALIEKYNPSLPDSFLKKWILASNDQPVTPEEVERDYNNYRRGLQWQLIFNNLIGQKAISITQEEVVQTTKNMMANQYAQYGIPAPEDQELTQTALKVLSNKDESRKIYDMLYDEKLVAYIRENATVNEKEVSYDAFVEMASKG